MTDTGEIDQDEVPLPPYEEILQKVYQHLDDTLLEKENHLIEIHWSFVLFSTTIKCSCGEEWKVQHTMFLKDSEGKERFEVLCDFLLRLNKQDYRKKYMETHWRKKRVAQTEARVAVPGKTSVFDFMELE